MKPVRLLLFLGFLPIFLSAQIPGTLDLSFGDNGLALTQSQDTSKYQLWHQGLCVDTDRNIVQVGIHHLLSGSNRNSMVLWKHDAAGKRDTSFGESGFAWVKLPSKYAAFGTEVVTMPDQKILAFGNFTDHATLSVTGLVLARFFPDGRPDTSFGTAGRILHQLEGDYGSLFLSDIKLQSDDKILITGRSPDRHLLLMRYYPDGRPDSTFNGNGIAVVPPLGGSYGTYGNALAIQPDGKIVVAGGYYAHALIVRYHPDGTLDTTFGGGDGMIYFDFEAEGYFIESEDLFIRPDGKIVVAGTLTFDTNDFPSDITLFRLNTSGELDIDFGNAGFVYFDVGLKDHSPLIIGLNDGNMLITGSVVQQKSANQFHNDPFVFRMDGEGVHDLIFGTGGYFTQDVADNDVTYNMALQSGDKLLLGGRCGYSGQSFLLRLNLGQSTGTPIHADENPIQFTVQPNPVSDRFMITAQLPGAGPVSIHLFDQAGRQLGDLLKPYYAEAGPFRQIFAWPGNLPRGFYNLRIMYRGNATTLWLLKE